MTYRECLLMVAAGFRRLEVMAPAIRADRLYGALSKTGADFSTRMRAVAALRIAALGEKGGFGLLHEINKRNPQQIADLCEKAAKVTL